LAAMLRQLAGMLQNFEMRAEREVQTRRQNELRELAVRSELRALQAQIQPHFLFNALNSLAYLTQEDPKAAETGILHLSRIFRYVLDVTRKDIVKLGEELDFIDSYLAMERLRFEDKLEYEIDAGEVVREYDIPPVLIQPLVENAVKHGISRKTGVSTIRITASVHDSKLRVSVEDSGVGFDAKALEVSGGGGVGLINTRSRLERIPGAEALEIDSAPGAGTRVSFEIPAKQVAKPIGIGS